MKVKLRLAYCFLKRYEFSIRNISHTGQFIQRLYYDIKSKFIAGIFQTRKKLNNDYDQNDCIINMNETPCYLDMNYDTTIGLQCCC